MAKVSHQKRIAALVNAAEAAAFLELERMLAKKGERWGLELLPPEQVQTVSGMRPGLVCFAEDGAGDLLAWDLRRPSDAPPIVYCDHEVGMATPFARDVRGAFQHIMVRELIGEKGKALLAKTRALRDGFELVPEVAALFDALERKAQKSATVAPLRNEDAAYEAVRFLLPEGARGGLAWLPHTHYPVLDPSDPKWLDSALESYDEAIACFRELVHEEGREVFSWHLADTLKNAAGVLLLRERHEDAEAAAREAITLYEPILERGDTRVIDGLSVAHSALSVLEARKERYREAHGHADQALALLGRSIGDAYTMLQAHQLVLEAWEDERAGRKGRSRENLRFAAKKVDPFREMDPPHSFREASERIARLAGRRR